MAKLLNLDAETGANIIDADATEPTLKLSNASGVALEMNSAIISSNSTINADRINVNTPILAANATIVGLNIRGASVASGAVLSFSAKALVSCTTITFTTGAVAGTKAIRIVCEDGTFAWIPVLPSASVTAAAL